LAKGVRPGGLALEDAVERTDPVPHGRKVTAGAGLDSVLNGQEGTEARGHGGGGRRKWLFRRALVAAWLSGVVT